MSGGTRRSTKRARDRNVVRRQQNLSGWWLIVPLIGLAGLIAVFVVNNGTGSAAGASSSDTKWDSAWPPLPEGRDSPPRPLPDVRAAYAFAARRADILQYIPCYCGCERRGHRSNVDCYIKQRTGSGAPVWDDHAFT